MLMIYGGQRINIAHVLLHDCICCGPHLPLQLIGQRISVDSIPAHILLQPPRVKKSIDLYRLAKPDIQINAGKQHRSLCHKFLNHPLRDVLYQFRGKSRGYVLHGPDRIVGEIYRNNRCRLFLYGRKAFNIQIIEERLDFR